MFLLGTILKGLIFVINCSFLCLPKETNQRKGSLSLGPPSADYPALLEKVGRCETRPPQADSNSPRAYPSFSVLLGFVKWQKTPLLCLKKPAGNKYFKFVFNKTK